MGVGSVPVSPGRAPTRARRRLVLGVLVAVFVVVLVRCAWMADDAFITFRTVQNFWHGDGLRWNTDERVQSYTHPLWMLLAAGCYGVARELYFSVLVLSIALATAALATVTMAAESVAAAVLGVVLLAGSRAVVDYAACGLENPLLFFLLALLAIVTFDHASRRPARRVLLLGLLTGLVWLTRPEAVIIPLAVLAHALGTAPLRRRALGLAALGLFPVLAWETFSLTYYGFLFANTAYAKLNVDVPRGELVMQGIQYLLDSLGRDPLTLVVCEAAIALAVVRGGSLERALALGVVLYLTAVVFIGGDFMSGRYLGAPLFVGVPLILRLLPPRSERLAGGLALAVAVGTLVLPGSHWLSGSDYGASVPPLAFTRTHGIADERAYYYPSTGLLPVLSNDGAIAARSLPLPPYRGALEGRRAEIAARTVKEQEPVATVLEAGFFGYFAGGAVHVLDRAALGDPLLARLPFEPRRDWRIGHFERPIPEGYEAELAGTGKIKDERLAAYNDVLRLITRGPLFTAARWRAILRMSLGAYDALLQEKR